TLWNLPHHFIPHPHMTNPNHLPFFNHQELINMNPLLFHWQPIPVVQGQLIMIPNMVPMDMPQTQFVQEDSDEMVRGSFIEISNLRNATLMIFFEKEDKKYIHKCPLALVKCSFNLRPSLNNGLAKYAVVTTPTLRPSQFNNKEFPVTMTHPPPKQLNLMIQPTGFVV
ncbi:hypothetical protein HAX54_013624, partial [Datura stramonium]|nr:hypothetical protein [Datura stramonium]